MPLKDKILIYALLGTVIFIGYILRYELDIVSPSYGVGQCLSLDVGTEFENKYVEMVIVEVGEHNYTVYYVRGGSVIDSPRSMPIRYIDTGGFKKVPCNQILATRSNSTSVREK